MYCSVMFGGFNTREGVRWFKIFLEKISLKRMTSFNTREGVRCFIKHFSACCQTDKFQYPCGCEMLPKAKYFTQNNESFNTREGVRWFGYTQETDVERLYYTVSIPVRV